MASDYTDDVMGEPGSTPLDIDNVLMLLQVEQEQIQKRTFTNWVNAQLAKRRPPCSVVDLFNDFRDGSKLLDLLEVMSDQRIIRERGRGTFQHRSNIEKGLSLLRSKSIKLVNINIPDIIDGKPCIILGLVWTIILQYHIEELASGLCFTSHQSSMESLASLDSGSWRSVGSAGGATGSMLRQGSPLHARFRLSAKKTLMLWVREQCHKAGCSANVKDFKGSWRSGVLFLAILSALRHHLVDLSEVAGRSNRENLDEAFRVAEQELGIPRLLEPVDVDVQEPDEKSIMTYVTQFLRYSKDVSEEDSLQDPQPPKATSPVSLPVHYTPAISASPLRQVNPERKVQEVSCWLLLAHEELLEGWDSTRGENYCERYNVFHTFVTSFNEQRPSIMSLLSAVRRSSAPSEEQRGLKEAWDALTQKLHEYKLELDGSLPAPLDVAARWLRSAEDLLAEEDGELRDHRRAADQAKEKREQLKVCLQEISQQMSTFQAFQKQQEYGTMLVPIEKIEDLKRRFTGVRVSAKYHNIQLKYRQHRHTVLDLLSQIGSRVHLWARPYLSPEALRLLLHDWHELVTNQELPSSLEAALQQLKGVSEIYSTKSALSADYRHIYQQETLLEEDTAAALAQVSSAKNTLARVLSAWDSYSDEFSSMQAWLEQDSDARGCGSRSTATAESVAEWATRHAHLNDVASFLMESTDPRTSSSLEEELVKLNAQWADFVHRNTIENLGPIVMDCSSDIQSRTPHVQALLKETTLLLQKPVQTMSDPLRTYWKRIQLLLRRLKDVDLEALVSSPESSVGQLEEVKMAVAEASETLCEADRLCAVLQCSISSLDTRLAELLHWETEAQEMHQLLGTTEQQQQQQQYPRVQVLISRGLQLEGQVVTEEQALQASIRANQKSPPIPYLQTTVMQDRVQAALAQSQEVVRMLSNLGARRDTSTSPTEGRSAKVFIRDENTAPQGRRPDTAPPQTSPVELHPCHETFLSNVVVQHCGEGRKSVSSHSSAQQIPTAEAPTPSWTGMSEQQQTMELNSGTTQQKPKCHRPHVQVRAKGEPKVGKMHQDAEHQPTDTKECKAGQYVFTHVDVEPKLPHKAETHEPISSLRPQCKKAQAVKNRPWLRNRSQVRLEPALQGRVFAQGPTWAQDRPVSPMQDMILPSHIQVGCHLQSWAPVGPDTPMPLACSQAEPEPLVGAQASSEPRPEPENQAQEILPHQYQSQMPQSSPAHTQAQAQTPPQKSVAPSQAKAEPIATVHVAPGQTHARTQVGSWSAMSAQPGALVELQARPPTFIQEPQCQDAIQHRHHTPQPVVEAPQAPQLAPSARPQRPYMRHSGYSTMPQPSPLQQMQLHSHALVQAGSLCQARPQIQHSPMRAAVLTLPQCVPEQFATQLLWRYKAEFQLTAQPRIATLTQGSALAASKPLPQPLSPLMTVEHPLGPATQFQTQTQTATIPDPQSPAQAMLQVKLAPQAQDPSQDKQKDSVAVLESHMCVRSREESPHLLAPRQAYTKARALAQSNFEKSKHCLQEHILEAVSHQAAVTNTLRTLDPELLEGFLRAAKSMEAFCTPWQLRDMQLLTQSFSAQWEAYFSSEGDGARACQRVEALRELCHVLSPQDAHRLAHTQQSECESSLAVIQRQFGSDQQAPQSDERVAVFKVEQTPSVKSMPLGTPQIPSEVSQNKPKAVTSEQKVPGQSSVDEDGNQKEALEKYEISMNSLQVQLWKNEQVMGDVPSDSVTLKDLHSRLQELQFLRQDTESLWLEFTKQCSQLPGREQEKCYLQNQWRAQQAQLQGRGGSLGAALRQIDSTENHMVDFTERLERYLRQAKDIKAFTLTDANILKDIKELDKNIQSELDQLVHLNPEYSNLDPRDCLPLSREVEAHRCSLYQLAQQVRKSEAAARALDLFLVSLRTVKEDIDRPCADASCAKLALDSLKDKAPQLNLLLQGARLMFTRDGSPASCLDMVSVLLNKLEEADSGALKRDACSQFLGLRKRTLLEELRKIRATVEARGLTEATVPAVQHRLRALSDVEGQLQAHNSEIQGLKELPECQSQNLLEELEAEYNSTLMSLANSKHQCGVLTQLLKTFQSCRSHMSGIVLRAEQTVGEQASYMGKDNLRRTIAKVVDIKEDLSGLGERMDELRTVCRQLQSQLKKFPECREAAFEAEADRLMDIWLDVIEKVDAYMDNLQVGSELWDKELALGAEIDNWIASKLALFAESHPFHNQQQVLALKEEIQVYEKNIQHFHNNCEEIQKLLQSHESPLELQVMETQLRKRLEQVKELFADCTDVFEELMVVKNHLGQKLQACLSAVENIKGSVSKLQASQPDAEAHLQDLHDGLEAQEEQAELVLREMALVSGVAGTQVLEELWAGCGQLMDVIARTKDAIRLKREEKGKGPFEVIQDERQSFEGWFQDLRLAIQVSFEEPESSADVETALQKLTGFLKANHAEDRLEQLKEHMEGGHLQIHPQQLRELKDWLNEQYKDVDTFKARCLSRQKQMESLSRDMNRLQTQCDAFHEWLRGQEELSTAPSAAQRLHLQESQAADVLVELLDSVRRHGVTADPILKDVDDAISRYRKLEARLWAQAEEEKQVMDGGLGHFTTQAQYLGSWFKELLCSFTLVCSHLPYQERSLKAQAVLSAKEEGDTRMKSLQLQCQSLCEQDPHSKQRVQQALRDLEDEWRSILRAAQDVVEEVEMRDKPAQREHLEAAMQSEAQHLKEQAQSLHNSPDSDQAAQEAIRGRTEAAEASAQIKNTALPAHIEATRLWIEERRQQLLPLGPLVPLQERLRVTQATELEQEIAQEDQLKAHQEARREVRAWLQEKQQNLNSLHLGKDPQVTIKMAQDILSSKPQGDGKMAELQKQSWDLCPGAEPESLTALEELWAALLRDAENALSKAEVFYSLSRELQAFFSQASGAQAWVDQLQTQLDSVSRMDARGGRAQIEERLSTVQMILSSGSSGESRLWDLQRRAQSLGDHQDLEQHSRLQMQTKLKQLQEQFGTVLQAAERASRQLQSVEDLLVSCLSQRGQAEARLAQLWTETSNLPCAFPWPGLGERSQAAEGARSLLDKASAMGPLLLDLRTRVAELFEATQDPDWADSTCAGMVYSVSALLQDLTDTATRLEQGIVAERRVAQLLEQHEVAQDWLREQVKRLEDPTDDRARLHGAINTLKALLQTVDREQKEMKELDAAREHLLGLCTSGGGDALTLAVSHLGELCANSEQYLRERLRACEARLRELDCQAAHRTHELKEKAAALLWELSSLDQVLGHVGSQNGVCQMQRHWDTLRNCEKSLQELRVHIDMLKRELAAADRDLPSEIRIMVQSMCQQHESLESRLSQQQRSCSTNMACCLSHLLQALQDWNGSEPSRSGVSLQDPEDERQRLLAVLGEAFEQRQFLSDCLDRDVFEQLSQDISEVLRGAGTLKMSQCQEEPNAKGEATSNCNLSAIAALDAQPKEAKMSLVAPPPRKNKQSAATKSPVEQNTFPTNEPVAHFVTDIIESAISNKAAIELESRKTSAGSHFGTGFSQVVHMKEGRISPPAKKSKSVELSTQVPVKETTQELNLHDREHPVCEEATEVSASGQACGMTEVVTATRHANIVSEQNHPEEAAAGIAQFATVYQRNLSPPARRSTNIMLTPMLPTAAREGLVYAAETSQEHKVCEEAPKESTSQEATVGTGLIESAMSQLPQEVEGTSSASVVPSSELVEAEGEISPPKRKLKAAEPHFHETAEQKLLDGSEQTKGVVAPRPPKRKPKRSTVPPPIPKEGHPERLGCADVAYAEELAKREMIPQEPPKSPKHKAASLYVEPDLAATNVAGPEPAASVLVDGKLSESFKVAPRPIETSPVAVEQGASENDEGKNLAKPAQALCITKVRSPVQAVIELELLEVAREPAGQANAKDVAVENDNAKRCLSRDGAPVDALQLNIQMDKDFSAETALQGESPMVLAGQLVETVLCDEAVEKTCKAEINLQRPTDDEEHDGASLPVGALQDTPVTIHMGPHVRLVQVEIKPCQEQNKDKLETEAVEEPEKATVDEMSPGGKPNTSAERNAGKVVSVAQKDKAKCNQKEKPPQLIQTEEIGTVPLAASLGDAHMAVTQDSKMKELSQGESLMTMPREESSESLAEAPCQPDPEAKEVSQGETSMTMAREESPELAEAPCQLDPMANEVSQGEFFMTMPQEESPESLAESPCQPDPKALAAAQTEARQMDAPTEQSQNASRCEVYATGTLQMRQASVKRSESDTDIAERASLTDIFSELKATAEMEILHADSCDDCLAELMSSTNGDLNVLLCGLVSNLVSCKNRSAELQVAAMSRQLKEAKKCHDTSREQAALLEAEGDSLEKRWSAAARDAAAVVMDKVQRLQLVQNFFQQNDKVKTTLEHLAAQLNMSRLAAAESHHQEAECLNSTKRAFKENRSVLRELLGIHARLHPLLGHAHRAAAKNVIETRQEDWRALERATEKALHWSDVQARSCSDLLLELSYLRGHLELLSRQLEGSPWDCAKVTQLMIAHAEVKAAHVKYYHLKERSEALPSNVWPKERHEIKKALDNVKDQLCLTEEWMASKIQMSGDAVTRKVLTLGRDGLSWAKQMESSIEGMCTRVPLLPEEVHHQLGALKKLQSQVMAKHRQLELQVKAEIELLPQLDGVEEMPAVGSMLKCLQEHSKSLIQKLTDATAHLESGLRIREAVAERIADLDYWVGAHLQRETLETVRTDFATADGESQEVPIQVEKQCATCEALFMQTKDIASELSVAESCQLFDKLTQLQEEISNIGSCWRAERKEFEEHARSVDSSERELVTVEHSLRRMEDQLHQLKFPTLTESLEVLEYFQHQLLEHRSTIGLLWAWTQEVKTNEFDSVVAEIQNQLTALRLKASEQHKYLYMRQNAEALKEAMEEQVCQTKEDTRAKERYKTYHKLLCNFPLIKGRCKEVVSKLQMISTDFDPAQLRSEQRRLQQNEESLQNVKTKIFEGLGGIKCALLQELDLDSGRKAMRAFLEDAHRELQKPMLMAPDEAGIHRQFQKVVFLKNTLEWRMRALELLEEGSARSDLRELTNCVLRQCDSQMDNISDARTSLRNYTQTVKRALQFLRDVEISLLLLPGVCGEKLEETKEILDSLEDHFQTHMDQLSQVALDPSLSPLGVERLQESTLSQLLVRMSTLKAKGYIQLENLSSCAENNRKYAKSLEGISLHARNAEASLEYFVSREAHSLDECTERLRELQVLRADLDCALRQLEDMEEWCPEQRCQAQWETSAAVAWTRVIKLRFGSRRLSVRLEQRIVEWSNIARSVEKASAALRQTEEELPELAPLMGSTKELVDLQQCWEKYRDRLDCEHGALCALEQRVARLLGVHDGTEEEPPTPLCQHLQAIRAAYGRVKRSSRDGLEQIKLELEDNEKLQEELQVVWMWLTTTDSLLSQMDPSNGIVELKVLHGQLCVQKALVRGIRERLKSKYLESDVVPLEIHGRLQEVQKALEQVQAKVEEAMETSGPTHRIEAELLETQVGLRSVQERLQDRSCNMADAKRAQKLVWDELKKWHSQVAALEANVRDHAPSLTQRLAAVQQLCVQLTERAEQKTALIGKTQGWLEEHREMITSSKSWMLESQAWLATPRTYTTSKCLSEHVTALQMVLKDAAQIRNALESFSSVLEQMSQVVDVSAHLEQRAEADRQLAAVQNSFAESLSQMERAAAEVTAMETEAIKMETDVAEIKTLLCSPETLFSPKKKHLKMLERRIRSMRSSITDIQKAKLLLRLPEKTDKTLTVLRLINQLQTSLPDLEKKIQALSIQQRPAQRARGESLQAMSLMELELPRSLEEREKGEESEESEESKVSQVDDPEPNETKEAAPGQRHAGVAHIVTPHEDSMPERSEVSMPERSQASPEQSQEASGTTEQNCFEDLSSSLESVTHPKDPEAMVNTSTGSKSPAASQQRCSLC
ncbi:uncharacterized protein syne2b isoform 3-T3 [Syngnathus typhle]